MKSPIQLLLVIVVVVANFVSCCWKAGAFVPRTTTTRNNRQCANSRHNTDEPTRRSFLIESASLAVATAVGTLLSPNRPAIAAVGNLYEYSRTNAILQGISVNVADPSQEKAMVAFMEDAFDCLVLRKRIRGTITETWLGFGPEQLSVPADFVTGVSSLANYGGHASIHVVYDARASAPLYRNGDENPPGDNIAYLQLGVPTYRISQMVKNGGAVIDAYGIVNVISPSGLPIRGIVGIAPDPIMFVAINCANVLQSKAFYEKLGFSEQEYPYCRPNKGQGQFEPPQPLKSVYMGPSENGMGILLLPSKKKRITPNPVVDSLHIVYTPVSSSTDDEGERNGDSDSDGSTSKSKNASMRLVDPSGVMLEFQSVTDFEAEEQLTR